MHPHALLTHKVRVVPADLKVVDGHAPLTRLDPRHHQRVLSLVPLARISVRRRRPQPLPGPINRGIEMDQDVADGPRSAVLRQVTHGVAVRMASLCWCLGIPA